MWHALLLREMQTHIWNSDPAKMEAYYPFPLVDHNCSLGNFELVELYGVTLDMLFCLLDQALRYGCICEW